MPASLDRMDRLNWHLQLPDTMFLTAQYRASRLKRPGSDESLAKNCDFESRELFVL